MTILLATVTVGTLLLSTASPATAQPRPQGFWDQWHSNHRNPDSDISGRARDEAEAVSDQERDRLAAEEAADLAALQSRLGAEVASTRGDILGHLVNVVVHADNGEHYALIEERPDVVRFIEAERLTVDPGGALLLDLTAYQFRRLPELRPQR